MAERNSTNLVTLTTAVVLKVKQEIALDIFNGVEREKTFERLKKVIEKFGEKIADDQVRTEFTTAVAKRSIELYDQLYRRLSVIGTALALPISKLLPFVQGTNVKRADGTSIGVKIQRGGDETELYFQKPYSQTISGTPYDADIKEFLFEDRIPIADVRKKVKAELNRLMRGLSKDEIKGADGRTLRASAEMHVRYEAQRNSIADMRRAGVKLAWASTHRDCSPRCAPWQGKLYSLDGTSGTTEEGYPYQPLENATNILTKNGKWFNGLFGFNCFDDETEVYTSDGWKKFADVTGNELFYTLDKATRTTEWQKPLKLYKQAYNGDLVHFVSSTLDCRVTPSHDMLYFTQKNAELRYREAQDINTANYFYAGQEWTGENPETICIGGKEVPSRLAMKLLAYYLADGSLHRRGCSIKIAQENNTAMYNELKALPFEVWHDKYKIIIYGKQLADEFAEFGTATTKFVPDFVKGLSRELLGVFLDGYISTDGYIARHELRGRITEHKTVFTTSKRLADDLGEIALKAGYKPKFDLRKDAGKVQQFKNGMYTINNDMWVIHLNNAVNYTAFEKRYEPYKGFVYCVEVPNRTLLVRRNGRIVWCGNCRHRLIAYHPRQQPPKGFTEAQQKKYYQLDQIQRGLEVQIRSIKETAHLLKITDETQANKLFARAREMTAKYRDFCVKNDLVAMIYRTQVTTEEQAFKLAQNG